MIVNQKQLAECLGISSRRVRQLREEGLFKLTQEGKGYNLEKSIQEYIEYKVNAETGRRASISKEEVQAEYDPDEIDGGSAGEDYDPEEDDLEGEEGEDSE